MSHSVCLCPIHSIQTSSCKFCNGSQFFYLNHLKKTHPNLTPYWHPTLNQELTMYEVTATSKREVWWYCPTCKASWKASVKGMVDGWGCVNDCHNLNKKR